MTQPAPPQSQKKIDAGRIPGPVVISGGVEILVQWFITGGAQFRVMLHGRNPGAVVVDAGLATTLQNSLGAAWNTNLALYASTDVTFQTVIVRDMSNASNPPLTGAGGQPVGTSASPLMPREVALVLTENLFIRGRGVKGRLYIPGWATNADAGGGSASGAVVSAMNTMGTAWKAAIQAAGLVAAVAHPARQEYIGLTGTLHARRDPSMVDVSTYTCRDAIWDSQRRRRGL